MSEQLTDGDVAPVIREIREYGEELVVVAQFSIVYQQHDGHGRELLGARGQTEAGSRVNLRQRSQVADAVAFAEESPAILVDEDRQPRRPAICERREDRINFGCCSIAGAGRPA